MFKALLFACLFVAVFAGRGHNQQTLRQPQGQRRSNGLNGPQNSLNRIQNSANQPKNGRNQPLHRAVRQMPQMPDMNPGQIPQMMADGVKNGVGVMANMMDPNKWMQAASQMLPKSKDFH